MDDKNEIKYTSTQEISNNNGFQIGEYNSTTISIGNIIHDSNLLQIWTDCKYALSHFRSVKPIKYGPSKEPQYEYVVYLTIDLQQKYSTDNRNPFIQFNGGTSKKQKFTVDDGDKTSNIEVTYDNDAQKFSFQGQDYGTLFGNYGDIIVPPLLVVAFIDAVTLS